MAMPLYHKQVLCLQQTWIKCSIGMCIRVGENLVKNNVVCLWYKKAGHFKPSGFVRLNSDISTPTNKPKYYRPSTLAQ